MGNSRIIAITTFNPASAKKSNTQDENSRHMHIKNGERDEKIGIFRSHSNGAGKRF